jgi:GGDEF domain-containing protein
MGTSGESLFSKRVLIELSHAIEQFALAAEPGSPLLVIAMFQKLSYFEREVAMYREIASRGAVTLIGLVEDMPPQLPAGVRHTLLGAADPLAREWSVTVLGPRGGATLVAYDQERVGPDARTLEEGRSFVGRWSFNREDAYREVLRLRLQLDLSEPTVTEIDQVLRAVLDEPEPRVQRWWTVPLQFLADRMDHAMRERAAATSALETATDDETVRDPRTGLYTGKFLERWTAGLGAGTLPIGLVLLRVFGVDGLRKQYGLKAELAVLHGLSQAIQEMLSGADRVIRLGREDFLVVLPSWPPDQVQRLCDELCARLTKLDQVFPFVALPVTAAAIVTRDRPLPLGRLAREVEAGEGPVKMLVG